MAKKVYKKIGDMLLLPFTEHFLFFIVFCTLITTGHIFTYFNGKNVMNVTATIVTAMHCVNLSYIVTLLISFIHNRIVRQIFQTAFIIYAGFDFAICFYCSFYLHFAFDCDLALLIKETNLSETKEFFASMVPMWMVLTIAGIFLLLGLLVWLIKRYNLKLNLGKKVSQYAMGIICICTIGWHSWENGPIWPLYQLSLYDNPSDLKAYYSHPQLTYEENHELPTNVVLIIGESFTRCHSSMYGYDKLTNPQLAELKGNSLLFSFDSIDSPAPTTAYSIRDMLSTYNNSDKIENKKWYEYISLIEIMKDSGYNCFWYGNQGRVGQYNGTSRVFANSCDHQWFQKSENTNDRQFDIVLADSSYQTVKQVKNKNHNFIIYHLMGSHFHFSQRYPDNYAHFSVDDYPNEPQNHREILSSYDNSILYNDYVVRKIMDLFEDSEVLIIYLSDHGQVMFRNSSDPGFYAHGRDWDPVDYALGVEIPFFIYASPSFQQKYPQVIERIKYRQDHPKKWNSEDLPYLIMDLIGVETINGEKVSAKSILN